MSDLQAVVDALREARDGAREATKAARDLQGVPAALERVSGLASSLQGLASNAGTIREATSEAERAAEAARSAVDGLHALRGTITRARVATALLGLLLAFGGGFVVGQWFAPPGLWPLGLRSEASCERAAGEWLKGQDDRWACVFWD